MNDELTLETSPEAPSQAAQILDRVKSLIRGNSSEQWMATATMISFICYFTVAQEIIKPLGAIRGPMLISNFCFALWLTRMTKNWTPQTKFMLVFWFMEGVRNILGMFVFENLVMNDHWAVHTWKDLYLQFFGLMFPAVVFWGSGKQIRRVTKLWLWIAVFLGLWVCTHLGRGPGNFMGDENDVCLVLTMFLGIPLVFLVDSKAPTSQKLIYMMVSMIVFAGIAITKSRGGFLGFATLAIYFLLFSRKKVQFLIIGAILCTAAVAVAPSDYISEIRSIQNTDTGTAADRRFFWKLATRMWKDNMLIGIGMRNTPFQLGDYAKPEELLHRPKPSGRATHSLYFELLPDLGLWGVFMVGSVLGLSLYGNYRGMRGARKLERRLQAVAADVRREHTLAVWAGTALPEDSETSPGNENEENATVGESKIREELHRLLQGEINLLGLLFFAANASLTGILASAAFISTLYYPPIWFLSCWSALLFKYWKNVSAEAEDFLQHTSQTSSKLVVAESV